MIRHGMIMVMHTSHGVIMARSWHGLPEIYDHGMVIMTDSMIIPWTPWLSI